MFSRVLSLIQSALLIHKIIKSISLVQNIFVKPQCGTTNYSSVTADPLSHTDLGKTVATSSFLVQIVLQQPLTHIFHDLDESEVSVEREKDRKEIQDIFTFIYIHTYHDFRFCFGFLISEHKQYVVLALS